jgi:CubicO group peptidase (beta-lactamase class C family)
MGYSSQMLVRSDNCLISASGRAAMLSGVLLCLLVAAYPAMTLGAGGAATTIKESYKNVRKQTLPLVEKVKKKYKVNGLSIALVDGGELVWAEGFGYADRKRKKRANAETIYRIGSVSKPFTATAVMQMVEQKVFDIDRPLQEYLPEFNVISRFQATADAISVRSVLSHHSGLPTDIRKGMWTDEPITTVADLLQGEYLAYPPDLIFNYSNIGYTLLGHMLQEHSGKEFTRHMSEYLFRPLGMQHTDYRLRKDMRDRMSRGYKGRKAVKPPAIRDLPAYSMYSNVLDMSRFMRMYLSKGSLDGETLLDPGSVEEIFRIQNLDVALDMNIQNGLGWYVEHASVKGAERVVRHGGATMLFASEMMLLPEDGLGVVILSNTKGSGAIIKKLAKRILKYSLIHKKEANPGYAPIGHTHPRPSHARVNLLIPEGKYATALGVLDINPKTNRICICDIKRRFKLVPQPGGWYAVPKKNIGKKLPSGYDILPDIQISSRLVNRREVIVAKRRGKEFLLGERVRDEKIPKKWKQRVGRYKVINPDSGYEMTNTRVAMEHGMLNISYKMPKLSNKLISVPIRPISDTEAIVLGLGRMRGEVLQVVMVKGKECLKYSGYIVRKI